MNSCPLSLLNSLHHFAAALIERSARSPLRDALMRNRHTASLAATTTSRSGCSACCHQSRSAFDAADTMNQAFGAEAISSPASSSFRLARLRSNVLASHCSEPIPSSARMASMSITMSPRALLRLMNVDLPPPAGPHTMVRGTADGFSARGRNRSCMRVGLLVLYPCRELPSRLLFAAWHPSGPLQSACKLLSSLLPPACSGVTWSHSWSNRTSPHPWHVYLSRSKMRCLVVIHDLPRMRGVAPAVVCSTASRPVLAVASLCFRVCSLTPSPARRASHQRAPCRSRGLRPSCARPVTRSPDTSEATM